MTLNLKNKKIAVIAGGWSNEREISLISGKYTFLALKNLNYQVIQFDPQQTDIFNLKNLDIELAFLNTHGHYGEDGILQGVMEILKIPYTGSGVMASAIAMNKYRTKLLWKNFAIPVAQDWYLERNKFDLLDLKNKIILPVVVKPNNSGSTLGLTKVYQLEDLENALTKAFAVSDKLLIERLILGKEYTISVFNGVTYPLIEIKTPNDDYDYQHKYFSDQTIYSCPAVLDQTLVDKINQWAKIAYAAIEARGMARIDFMIDQKQQVYFIEINTLPGMTDHSLVPIALKSIGISYANLCELILADASCNR